jgi:hypothetical protein
MNFRLPWSNRARTDLDPEYCVRKEPFGLLHVTARADHSVLTQALLEAVRSTRSPLGLVMVEAEGPHAEWAVPDLKRSAVLHALVALRDLLGRGLLDVAVFSSPEGFEVYLDRLGTLEIRAGLWEEPRLRSLLEGQGFRGVPGLSVIPEHRPEEVEWSEESRERYWNVQHMLERNQTRFELP